MAGNISCVQKGVLKNLVDRSDVPWNTGHDRYICMIDGAELIIIKLHQPCAPAIVGAIMTGMLLNAATPFQRLAVG